MRKRSWLHPASQRGSFPLNHTYTYKYSIFIAMLNIQYCPLFSKQWHIYVILLPNMHMRHLCTSFSNYYITKHEFSKNFIIYPKFYICLLIYLHYHIFWKNERWKYTYRYIPLSALLTTVSISYNVYMSNYYRL